MRESLNSQNLLAANAVGRRVTIGLEAPEELRRLSDARALTCPGCGAPVILHAGTVRAHHFAHLPGAVCRLPQAEPESEEHRAGKLLLARWLRTRLPEAEISVDAILPETGQRADILIVCAGTGQYSRRIALEYQCANLTAREWRRRHALYRKTGIEDLWLLGGSRLHWEPDAAAKGDRLRSSQGTLRTGELERALLWDGAPLLFLDAAGERLAKGTLARFRPYQDAQALRPFGRLAVRSLQTLDFPFNLLDWPQAAHPEMPSQAARSAPAPHSAGVSVDRSYWLREWLAQRFRVTPETLAPIFGLPLAGQETLACEAQLWQAALYYRFVHRRVGDSWWLPEVETWARAYLPLTRPCPLFRLKAALSGYQDLLAAAGFLSLPMGYGRVNARVVADLTTLHSLPDREEVLRLARYRRTLKCR